MWHEFSLQGRTKQDECVRMLAAGLRKMTALGSTNPLLAQVVACHQGSGCVAGQSLGTRARMVDGRLWLYDDGDIAFLFLEGLDYLIDLRRIDDDLR